MELRRVTVVGGGVVGLGTAHALLKEIPHALVTVVSEVFTPDTTSDGSGGMWTPYLTGDTPEEKVIQWSKATWDMLHTWWACGRDMGVSLVPGTTVSRQEMTLDPWHYIPPDYRLLTQEELTKIGPEYICGSSYTTLMAEPARFLPILQEILKEKGAVLECRSLASLEEATMDADLVINCSGLGARDLVPDPSVYPIRGQVTRVRAPWVNHYICDESEESFAYIIPNSETVVLGGTHQDNDWRRDVDPDDAATIWQHCINLNPSLKAAEVVTEWAGLRPGRKGGVRLEAEFISVQNGTRSVPVVHNYGHAGCGVTMFWGCALEAAGLAAALLHAHQRPPHSKL